MPVVISVQSRGAVSVVEFDDGASLRCTREFVRRSNLQRGQDIDDIFVDRLRETASPELARSEAQRLDRRQRYSRRQICSKLRDVGIGAEAANLALDELESRGELDDRIVARDIARKGLRQLISRDPSLSEVGFRTAQTRRLLMRGFTPGAAAEACQQVWMEVQ
ncbi:MAG: RecX family transcriptional regulator [Chloroflexi bacterium]|nr:RecX family transcriptional regulator [Chloroflexota bacterium]MYF22055.1 RecX family transcriptional regulator [Chloroflexota bacterium]